MSDTLKTSDIFNLVDQSVLVITDESMRRLADATMNAIRKQLDALTITIGAAHCLPHFHASHNDNDGSFQIEWPLSNCRIMFCIEKNVEDSNWYLITNRILGDMAASGRLEYRSLNNAMLWVAQFALANSQ